ncbi:hypothetical protein QFC22_006347 [Naganishia vaughanmartiniae]|uniref:Uncharacterized protein n=1 Tax=Naganishia vaughanmartiniae TaxID=1424756 RepID=A0ACC2WLH8_9TREE|nr:hypothetical protein QFC22_006347 [Naganishia vaughanmartiniae]
MDDGIPPDDDDVMADDFRLEEEEEARAQAEEYRQLAHLAAMASARLIDPSKSKPVKRRNVAGSSKATGKVEHAGSHQEAGNAGDIRDKDGTEKNNEVRSAEKVRTSRPAAVGKQTRDKGKANVSTRRANRLPRSSSSPVCSLDVKQPSSARQSFDVDQHQPINLDEPASSKAPLAPVFLAKNES